MARKEGPEMTMLQLVVVPKLDEIKALLQEGKLSDAKQIMEHDILGLLIPFRESELKTYENIPNSLKSAPNSVRTKEVIGVYEEVIQLLFDEKTSRLYYIMEQDLEDAKRKIQGILQAVVR